MQQISYRIMHAGPASQGSFRGRTPQFTVCASPPKQEMCFPPSEDCDPKKSTGPTPLRCICDKDLVFLVFTPKCEGKIRTKGSFCAPKRKCASQAKTVPLKKATESTPLGCICEKDLFFSLHPRILGIKCQSKEAFVPSSKIVPHKQKSCPKRMQQD